MTDHLDRFLHAQLGTFETAIEELAEGRKRTHWVWFIFPQLRGLGQSENSHFYGIQNIDEARDYLAHPILGGRLELAVRIVMEANAPAQEILGEIDFKKFVSCITLFGAISLPESVFNRALREFSISDEETLIILRGR